MELLGVAADCVSATNLTFEGNTTITTATFVTSGRLATLPGNPDGTDLILTGLPPFCRIQGLSKPTSDSSIYFEVWLPASNWNGKFLSSGEGGLAGALNYTSDGLDGGLDVLLRRGYATASTDTGHSEADKYWAIGHPEKALDYLYRAKHLVTVASKGLIAAYYGRPPTHSYFNSCSNGGRQGLLEVQRYPDDYDGVVVGAPWNFQSRSAAGFAWDAQALRSPGAAIPNSKLPAIAAAALAACDANDGLVDGVIANPPTCSFDPGVLLCRATETDSYLTQPQLAALLKLYSGPKNPSTGEPLFPGFEVGGEASWSDIVGGPAAAGLGQRYFANFVFENAGWDLETFKFDRDVDVADAKVGRVGNAIETDLMAAKRRGVKIIQYQGWSDNELQPAYSPEYYNRVVERMGGLALTRSFYRLFMVPGLEHCDSGPGANSFGGWGQQEPPIRDAAHDLETALEEWVEKGVAPEMLIASRYTDSTATQRTIALTRKLCMFPSVSRYSGSGDPNDATNFRCE